MKNVLEKVSNKTSAKVYHDPDYPGITFDENGEPEGKTIVEIMDKLDRKFVNFYGEYGRRMVNEDRERWNKKYPPWHFDLF